MDVFIQAENLENRSDDQLSPFFWSKGENSCCLP